ncbi:hypothetical protein Taro_002502 [Colocasia esculenta]|uniref:Uncharacterized protein n=1 Tax=Colocasia esculenta TaxID=4460 RepID=A0A843TLS2_COLES|nr:hypothetical protein [Colocasia esculenta]
MPTSSCKTTEVPRWGNTPTIKLEGDSIGKRVFGLHTFFVAEASLLYSALTKTGWLTTIRPYRADIGPRSSCIAPIFAHDCRGFGFVPENLGLRLAISTTPDSQG